MPQSALLVWKDIRGIPNKRDMHTHVTVHAGAIETDIQAKRDTCPRWVAGLTVKTHLKGVVGLFQLGGVVDEPCFPCQL